MANVLAPFGFRPISSLSGSGPNFAIQTRKIAMANATAIFSGDPVVSLSSGYITQATAGTTQIAGIFLGCKYLSTSQGRTVENHYYPGSDAAADVEAYIISAPDYVFEVQANAGPVLIGSVNNNINFAIGTGNTSTGISGATVNVSTIATTSTLPFRIIDFGGSTTSPAQWGNGSDSTTAYNLVYVTLNNQDYKSLTGI